MRITLLGTGTSQGVPVIACNCHVCRSNNPKDRRSRSSVMIHVDNQVIVIDTGPDFRNQMLDNNVNNIDSIIYTHEHKDHVAGLDDVRAFNQKWKKPINIYLSNQVSKAIKREYHYIFVEKRYPGIPEINLNIIDNNSFFIGDTKIIPIQALHYKLPVFGFRIKNFVYLTDISYISEEEKEKLYGADLLVLDSLRRKPHLSHFNLQQSLELINQVSPKKSLLTHISHYMGLHDELVKELPFNINPGYDGQVIDL
tara:strand:+ start:155 stop:916 length:762 start_codon:yes stop_codon:yes gene_type:complete